MKQKEPAVKGTDSAELLWKGGPGAAEDQAERRAPTGEADGGPAGGPGAGPSGASLRPESRGHVPLKCGSWTRGGALSRNQ